MDLYSVDVCGHDRGLIKPEKFVLCICTQIADVSSMLWSFSLFAKKLELHLFLSIYLVVVDPMVF
jgi:hypothetical protein